MPLFASGLLTLLCLCGGHFWGVPTRVNAAEDLDGPARVCASNLHIIRNPIMQYAGAHGGYLPTNLMLLQSYLSDPTKLICPANTNRPKPVSTNWSDFQERMITYRLFPYRAEKAIGSELWLQCVHHQHAILSAGIVAIHRGAQN